MSFPVWKHALAHLYYLATMPRRSFERQRLSQAGQMPIVILYYHRVADHSPNPWSCSNRDFIRQMRWLKDHFDMISLEETQQRMRSGNNARPAVVITFDDGYAENCEHALPWLVQERIPCTYFVSTRYMFDQVPFPHDLARGFRFAPNTTEQIRALARLGIDIGAHTRTHADLGKIHDPLRLHDEVVVAGEELQAVIDQPVRYFAFPFGLHANLNVEAFELGHTSGYEGICSAYGGANFPGGDAFHLQRIPTDAELIRIKHRVLGAPLRNDVPRYEYLIPQVQQEPVHR